MIKQNAERSNNKVPEYQTISVHLTTHRLILVPEPIPATPSSPSQPSKSPSLQASLRYVRQTEFYTGFMRSSPKITLTLGPPAVAEPEDEESWTCGVCGYVNSPTVGMSRSVKCGLCGVGQDTSRSISGPSSRTSTPKPSLLIPPDGATDDNYSKLTLRKEIPCPACTFLNHPSLTACEICSTPLPRRSTSIPRPDSAAISSNTTSETSGNETIRLSFRKGGVQDAYKRLKSVLSDKAWERVGPHSRLY